MKKMKIYQRIDDIIGGTPLLQLNNLMKIRSLKAAVIAKLEYLNPAGSVKDRAAKAMLDDAENRGLIGAGATIIEPTSGNTGIGLAAIGARRGYKVILTMPDTMSEERRRLLAAYGAEVVLTDGALGMKGAIEKAMCIKENTPNSFIPSQFDNPANKNAHYLTTGAEIWEDTCGKVDVFVAGVGTGGTLSGTGKFLKEKNPGIKVWAVEPSASPMIEKGESGKHGIQGIGANFVPENFDRSVCDGVIGITDEQAFEGARLLAKTEGILTGISSGAALYAAMNLALKKENEGKNIVVILPDTGDRYLSTDLFR